MFWKRKKSLKVVTHCGGFHADDVFATATLFIVFGEDNIEVIRTRDPEIIKNANIVFDVGHIYDVEKNRFDHHQGGDDLMRKNGIPYASFGLVWKNFASRIIPHQEIIDAIDKNLVQPVDAGDNGVVIAKSLFDEITEYEISDVIEAFNNTWKEKHYDLDKEFLNMVHFAKQLLEREIAHESSKFEAYQIVQKIYNETSDKRIIILDHYYPWKNFITKCPEPLFVIAPYFENYGVHAVPVEEKSFDTRVKMPVEWGGKEKEELALASGIPDAIFCHKGRHFAVVETKEGALEMAKKAIQAIDGSY
ncbi:MAG: MYG1 family protein [Candidatus Paceibacterota bacterium]